MYDTSFVCTYQLLDNDLDASNLYQLQFLQAFQTKEWNDELIGREIDSIYAKLKEVSVIKDAIQNIKKNSELAQVFRFSGDDDETIFRLFFGYELFYIIHKCICDYDKNGSISKELEKELLSKS